MNWLKEYSFLAEWLAIPVAIVVALLSVKGKRMAGVNWSAVLLRLAFVVSLSVALTSGHDIMVRTAATMFCTMIMVFVTTSARKG